MPHAILAELAPGLAQLDALAASCALRESTEESLAHTRTHLFSVASRVHQENSATFQVLRINIQIDVLSPGRRRCCIFDTTL